MSLKDFNMGKNKKFVYTHNAVKQYQESTIPWLSSIIIYDGEHRVVRIL